MSYEEYNTKNPPPPPPPPLSRARVSRIRDARDRSALRDRVRVQIRVATRDDENALAERRAETNRGREQPEDDPQSRSAEENCRHAPEVGGFFDYHRVPWLNKAAKVMWPYLDKAIASSVIWALVRCRERSGEDEQIEN